MRKLFYGGLVVAVSLSLGAAGWAADEPVPTKPAAPAATPAAAAAPAKGKAKGKGRAEQMKETLNLTDEQVVKIKAILKDAKEAQATTGKDKGAKKATAEKINAVLTPEQQVKWQQEHGKKKKNK